MDSHLCRVSLPIKPLKYFETLVMYILMVEATMQGAGLLIGSDTALHNQNYPW